jgi:hypothetical protein
MINAEVPILLVRLRRAPGVRETRRVVHLVPLPETSPATLRAWCGFTVDPDEVDLLPQFLGMPCEPCLAHAPTPEGRHLMSAIHNAIDTHGP